MTATVDFDRLLGSVLEAGGPQEVPTDFVEAAMDTARAVDQRHPLAARLDRRAWPSGRIGSAVTSPRVLATRLAVLGAAVVIVAIAVAGAFVVLQRPRSDISPVPSPSASPSAAAQASASVEPADRALRATWLANASGIESLGGGAGPVSLTIDSSGGRLAVDNFAPGAAALRELDRPGRARPDPTRPRRRQRHLSGRRRRALPNHPVAGSPVAHSGNGLGCVPDPSYAFARTWARSLAPARSAAPGSSTRWASRSR